MNRYDENRPGTRMYYFSEIFVTVGYLGNCQKYGMIFDHKG